MEFKVKDISLADNGALLVDWASAHMPVLSQIKQIEECGGTESGDDAN